MVVASVFLALVPACSREPTLYPVTGKVLYNNEPAEGARVVFHPADPAKSGSWMPSAIVETDGTFKLNYKAKGDGAALGAYKVAIVWMVKKGDPDAPEDKINKLPARYANAETSQIEVTLERGTKELPPFLLID